VAAYNRRKLTEHKRTNKSGSFTFAIKIICLQNRNDQLYM